MTGPTGPRRLPRGRQRLPIRRLVPACLVAVGALVPTGGSAQADAGAELCAAARGFLASELAMATAAEADTVDDVRTRTALPACRLTGAGLTTRSSAGAARHVFDRLRAAAWVRTPDPLDSPGEASLRFRKDGVDCLFTYVAGGLLDTPASLRVDSLVVPGSGERRYNVVVRCVPARPAAPGTGPPLLPAQPPPVDEGAAAVEPGRRSLGRPSG